MTKKNYCDFCALASLELLVVPMRPTVQFSPKNNKRIMFLRDTNAPASSLYSTKSYNLSHQTMTTSCSREAKAQKSQ
jgi:hypothetical protein